MNTFTEFSDDRMLIHLNVHQTVTNLETRTVVTGTVIGEIIGTYADHVQVGVIGKWRDANGKLFLNSTGKVVVENFHVATTTPHVAPDQASAICTALGSTAVFGGM